MKSWAIRLLAIATLFLGCAFSAFGQTTPGVIKAGKVEGDVYRLTADGQSLPVKTGDTLIESDTVVTEGRALVVLVFMNGSSLKLGPDSKLRIEEFKMDPLDRDIAVSKLKEEPSVSRTKLHLAQGELVGNVKKLNRASSYNVRTPVGAAGIRGTTFRIVFRPTGDGRSFTFQLATSEGVVVFEGTVEAPSNVAVAGDQEIVVTAEATVDSTSGEVTVSNVEVPAGTTSISTDALAGITEAVTTVIIEAVESTVITVSEQQTAAQSNPTPQQTPTQTEGTTEETPAETGEQTQESPAQTQSGDQPPAGTNSNPAPTTPAEPTTRPPSLTPGAG